MPKAEEMIRQLVAGHEAVSAQRAGLPRRRELGDEPTADLAHPSGCNSTKNTWMLRSMLESRSTGNSGSSRPMAAFTRRST